MYRRTGNINTLFMVGLCLLFFTGSLLVGETPFTFHELGLILFGKSTELKHYIFFHLRLPHTINAFVMGCLLALSGYLMQVMLANPLADPYTLGSSGGACVFILLGTLLGWEGSSLIYCSFVGSLMSICLLFILAGKVKFGASKKLLLTGMLLAAGWGALLSLLLFFTSPSQTKPILSWLFGDVDSRQYPLFSSSCLILGILCSYLMKSELEVLSQGAALAQIVGLDIQRVQIKLILLSALLTAAAVSIGGPIGFAGLIVPHLARSLLGLNQKLLLPCTLLLGGCLLLLADILSRVTLAPEQLPLGIVTTLIGIPFFLYLARGSDE